MAVGENFRAHSFTAFELYFNQFERSAVSADGEDAALVYERSGGQRFARTLGRSRRAVRSKPRAPEMQLLAAE
jgi:hypothetical protein